MKQSDLVRSNTRQVTLQYHSAPGTFKKVLVIIALFTKFGAPSTLIMFCAPGTTDCSLCSVNVSLPSSWLVSPSFCRWPDFLGRNLRVSSLLELSNLWRNCSWSSMAPLMSPNGNWGRALKHVVPSLMCCVMVLCTAEVILSMYLHCVMA